MNLRYLNDRQYYEDRYDRYTVERCRIFEESADRAVKDEKWPERSGVLYYEVGLYYFKGERFADREETIDKWMREDREKDEKFENTNPPSSVKCKFCLGEMDMFEKMLDWKVDSEVMRVVFYFRCTECSVGKKIDDLCYVEDILPSRCPGCTRDLEIERKCTKKHITTTKNCHFCGFKDVDVFDLSDDEVESKPDTEVEKRYRNDRDRFCFSQEAGLEYLKGRNDLESLSRMFKEPEQKKKEVLVERLTLPELEKRLSKKLAGTSYKKLVLGPPDLSRGVTVEFTVQNTKVGEAYGGKRAFKQLLLSVLGNTNWKLMSEGLECRLGVLRGRLRGHE